VPCNIERMADAPLTELALSPRWTVAVHQIDGVAHVVVLRIEHPRAGPLDFLLPGNDAMDWAAALAKTAERRDEARIGGPIPIVGHVTDAVPLHRGYVRARSWWSRLFRSEASLTSRWRTRRTSAGGRSAGSGGRAA
jgi:hypothetical protein